MRSATHGQHQFVARLQRGHGRRDGNEDGARKQRSGSSRNSKSINAAQMDGEISSFRYFPLIGKLHVRARVLVNPHFYLPQMKSF